MHLDMNRSFEPAFSQGSLLELGSAKRDFARRFLCDLGDVICVEASDIAIEEAKATLGDKVDFINSLFETTVLPRRHDNIALIHALEHLDDPVRLLRRISDGSLAEGGCFFLVWPNANAPSGRIAAKMGLSTHNAAVTPGEAEPLDTLERDALAAGLKVVHRSGYSSRHWHPFSRIACRKADIISREYLDGCYKL
jgi:SAM-dependent methyltransferase